MMDGYSKEVSVAFTARPVGLKWTAFRVIVDWSLNAWYSGARGYEIVALFRE